MPVLSALLLLASLCGARCHILAVGDSHVAFAGDISRFCRGQTSYNVGICATMAYEFGSRPDEAEMCDEKEVAAQEGGPPCCRDMRVYNRSGQENICRAERYPAIFGEHVTNATHVWFNIGNNDWLTAHCNMSETNPDTIVRNVARAMQNLRQALPTQPILMTGSCQMMETFPPGCTAETFLPILTQIYARACATDPLCTYVDSSAACPGGNATTLVPCQTGTHHDPIHVNARGYCYIFTQPAVQQALGCLPETYDCANLGPEVIGGEEFTGDWINEAVAESEEHIRECRLNASTVTEVSTVASASVAANTSAAANASYMYQASGQRRVHDYRLRKKRATLLRSALTPTQ